MLTREDIKQLLRSINFRLAEGKDSIWFKKFPLHDDFTIKVDLSESNLSKCKIIYGPQLKIWRGTTTNFGAKETLVVLECINRLLEKGYKPDKIELEKAWRVGGYLDILVRDDKGKSYLMIECKTYGSEYNRALKIMLQNENKEQLFNYYLQEKSTKYIALYSSCLSDGNVIYKNDIVHVEVFRDCDNLHNIYDKWDRVFQSKGIFEENITPYNIKFYGILRKELKTLNKSDLNGKEDTDGTIFNRFAEILRRHTISDKTNAYNKIFNLFLCKIVDEDITYDEDEVDFQWKESEDAVTVLNRLNDLYRRGMKEYLELDVADVSEEELNNELNKISNGTNGVVRTIKDMFKQLRLYKNNEFAFKEVIDERTFLENSEVIKEVVKLLEPYQIKYSHKEQFLGEFFERLLNIGVKQEAGQFFTPVPIADFVCKSIPFEKIINEKIKNKDHYFLPYIIDYACGSGHFLTESMDRVDKILQSIQNSDLQTQTQKNNIIGWKQSYKWAKHFVYGIEKDYRLAKTTKVACFLNGDGEANVIYGDGLDSFNSILYRDKLKLETFQKDNPSFDVVVANPPYSVEDFKFLLKNGNKSFELFDELPDKSDDIECLFVERTKHLLKNNGRAGIVLPNSLLMNKGIHQKTRELLLKYFEIIGICQFGNKTFAASGQNTSVMFLIRRDDYFWKKTEKIIDDFLKTHKDCSFNGVEHIFHKYISFVYPESDFKEYVKSLGETRSLDNEKIKLFYFLLTYNQKVIIADAGEKEDEKIFLGYEHSDMKKYEGIHPYPDKGDGKIISMLFDDNSLENPNKVSTFIYKNFLKKELPEITGDLERHLKIKYLHEMIDFDSDDFNVRIFTTSLNNIYLNTNKYPLVTLSGHDIKSGENYAEILDHLRKPIRKSRRTKGIYPYYGATGISDKVDDFIFNEKLVLIGEDGAKWGEFEQTAYIIKNKSWVNNHVHVVKPNTNYLIHEYLMYIFDRLDFSYLKSRPNGGKLIKSDLITIKFPLPSVSIQQKILKDMERHSDKEKYDIFDKWLGLKK